MMKDEFERIAKEGSKEGRYRGLIEVPHPHFPGLRKTMKYKSTALSPDGPA
jgi:hypothetical protein